MNRYPLAKELGGCDIIEGYDILENRIEQKRTEIESLFNPTHTVSEVVKKLRGLNSVRLMTFDEFGDYFGTRFLDPLEELADGTSYEVPKKHEARSSRYALHRNNEQLYYVIIMDDTALLDDQRWE